MNYFHSPSSNGANKTDAGHGANAICRVSDGCQRLPALPFGLPSASCVALLRSFGARKMKALTLILFISVLSFQCAVAQDLNLDEALKMGSDNGGVGNGEFWFSQGDSSPPFLHAGHITISRGSHISLTLNDGSTDGLGVDAPYDDGSQTRLDFFTSSNGKGWVAVHVLKPEIENTQPKAPRDERPSNHRALSGAAELAIDQGDLDFLGLLFKKGLKVNEALDFEDGDTLLHVATWRGKLDIVKFLLDAGADPTIRNHYGDRPIDTAISGKEEDLCALLARPDEEEAMVDGIPSGLIEAILPKRTQNEIIFISWNRADPAPELLAEILRTVPNARPASRMNTLDRRPLGAHSRYQDTESKEFGTLIEVILDNEGEIWTAAVRRTNGPVMAGGGWKGKARKKYGYWYTYDVSGWDE